MFLMGTALNVNIAMAITGYCPVCGTNRNIDTNRKDVTQLNATQHYISRSYCTSHNGFINYMWEDHDYITEEVNGHTYITGCSNCALTHTHDWQTEQHVTTPATCEEKGEYFVYCNGCAETKTGTLNKLGHNWGDWVITGSTGTDVDTHTRVCTRDSSHTETENHLDQNGDGKCDLCFSTGREYITKPTVKGTYTYSGAEQTVRLNDFDANIMRVTNNKRTIAGTQDVTVAIIDKTRYAWADRTDTDLTLQFTIQRKAVAVPSGVNYVYNAQQHIGVLTSDYYTMSGTYFATDVGNYVAKVTPTSNYCWEGMTEPASIGVKNVSWSITRGIAQDVSAANYEYDGTVKTGAVPSVGTYLEGTVTATNAGRYTITVKVDRNHMWSNGTTTARTISWRIYKKPVSVIWGEQKTFLYDRNPHAPTAIINSGVSGETINVTQSTAIEVGSHTSIATINSVSGGNELVDNYSYSNLHCDFNIVYDETTEFEIILGQDTYTYNGQECKPSVTVKNGSYTLSSNEYEYQYINNIDAGVATVVVNLKGDYTGSVSKNFTIKRKDIEVNWGELTFTYDGSYHVPSATAIGIAGETVSINVLSGGRDVGTYTAIATIQAVTGGRANSQNYSLNNNTAQVTINKRELIVSPKSGLSKVLGATDPVLLPEFSNLVTGEYPEDSGSLAREAGETVGEYSYTGIGSYQAITTSTFKANNYYQTFVNNSNKFVIASRSIESASVTMNPLEIEYTGSERFSEPTVVVGGVTLVRDRDYTVSYTNNINVGVAQCIITGKNNYAGVASGIYYITRASITNSSLINVRVVPSSMEFTGTPREPDTIITFNGISLVRGVDYDVSYSNNVNTGVNTANVIITGKKNLKDDKIVHFTITPKTITGAGTGTVEPEYVVYNGQPHTPSLTSYVASDGTILYPDVNYTVSYRNNIDAGAGTIVVHGINGFAAEDEVNFEIRKATPIVNLSNKVTVYTGDAVTINEANILNIYNYMGGSGLEHARRFITYEYYADSQLLTKLTTAPTEVGVYYVQATLAEDSNHYEAKSNIATIKIFGRPTNPKVVGNNGSIAIPSGGAASEGIYINVFGSEVEEVKDVLVRYKYRINGGAWINYSEVIRITAEGTYTIEAKAYLPDNDTLESDIVSYEITIDKNGPTTDDGSIVVPEETDTVVINVKVTNPDIQDVFITTYQSTVPTASSKWNSVRGNIDGETVYELTQGDEDKTLYIYTRDKAGNIAGPVKKRVKLNATKIGNNNINNTNI